MTAPEIPESALEVGETNLQVVGRLTSFYYFEVNSSWDTLSSPLSPLGPCCWCATV